MGLKKYIREKVKRKIKNLVKEMVNDRSNENNISTDNSIAESAKIINSTLIGNIKIGERAYIYKCEMFGSITIGNNTSVNGPNTDIHCRINSVKIGNFTSIARNVSIQEYNHLINTATSYFIKARIFYEDSIKGIESKGDIEIGNDVWVGTQCVILSGAKIGNGAVIAANSVVSGDIPPYAIAAGSPAKVLKYRFSEDIIKELHRIEWWNWPIEKIKSNYELFDGDLTLRKLENIK